ncbi:queuosine precursor transporter [Methylobacterium sp. M6A4_1b]
MTASSRVSGRQYLVPIAGMFSGVLIVSLILAGKIVSLGGLTFSAAVIVFPLSYLFGDILTEVYGYASARRVVWAGFAAQIVWIVSYTIAAALPPAPFWPHQAAFEAVLGATPRLALAGMAAYLVGEFANAYVLAKLKLRFAGAHLAARLVASTVLGQALDTALFVTIAFAGTFAAPDLIRLGLGAWFLKVLWEIVALPLSPPLIRWLKRQEGEDADDRDTDFNPFRLEA